MHWQRKDSQLWSLHTSSRRPMAGKASQTFLSPRVSAVEVVRHAATSTRRTNSALQAAKFTSCIQSQGCLQPCEAPGQRERGGLLDR
mmetsp:Transcript_117/g.205  ORF Transcript_117/g.205 Transcript_117/m.205 type:complete len:87 (-) Transcript_117:68-328(-)